MKSRRVALGVAAALFDKCIIAVVQILAVPVFATAWGLEIYGGWVLLSTIPSFLAVSDLGFAGAAGTKMTMLTAHDKKEEAITVFQSAWMVIVISSTIISFLAIAVTFLLPSSMIPHFALFDEREVRITLSILLIYGIVSLQGSILMAGFRCSGNFATGTLLTAFTVLFENIAAISIVYFGGSPTHAAAALLLCRLIALISQYAILRRTVSWLRVGIRESKVDEMRTLLAPALAIVALPLAQACMLQGTALALGVATSAAAVPAFTATRTLSRIGLQMTQMLNHALMPEYSVAVAQQNKKLQASIIALTLIATTIVVAPFAIIFGFYGPELVALWTSGVIHADSSLMIAMAFTVILGGIWNPLSNLILAMNRHASYVYPFIILSIISMPICFFLAKWFGATGAACSMVLLDLTMCVVILRLGKNLFVSPHEIYSAFFLLKNKIPKSIFINSK